jgi:hypothetical protein
MKNVSEIHRIEGGVQDLDIFSKFINEEHI